MSRTYPRTIALSGASAIALISLNGTALDQHGNGTSHCEDDGTIIVTGSRIQRDGCDAPTPVTAVDFAAIEQAAPTDVAGFINQMPQVYGPLKAGDDDHVVFSNCRFGLVRLRLRRIAHHR